MSRSLHSVRVPRPRTFRRALETGILGLATTLAVGCRGDSITMPSQDSAGCVSEPGCRATESTPVDPVVLAAIADASERLLPGIDDVAVRGALDGALRSLSQALQSNRSPDARGRLVEIYIQLDKLRIPVEGTGSVDLPDVAAIRLALVPVGNALGVQAR
jgi:hypothetical protein